MLKKIIASLLAVMSCCVLFACQSTTTQKKSSEKPTVTVTTSFLYDMVYQLAGDDVKRELIIPAGEDPHLYVAKSSDLNKLKNADLVLYHGLHFEGKMVDALEQTGVAVTKNFPKDKINTMEEDGKKIVDPHFWFDISPVSYTHLTLPTTVGPCRSRWSPYH